VISVVVPVHDEERTVALLFDELQAALEPLDQPWEAVFVDDGSTDGSFAALTRLHDAKDNVRVVRLRRNFGKAAARRRAETSSSRSTPTCKMIRPRSRGCWPSSRRGSISSPAGRRTAATRSAGERCPGSSTG
jgi:cellulose synthase/poly-beta-1,6-N-acetylglucosamine synthase-like glycosyltransferase